MNARALLASPFGFLIGLSLGALGGGGSILAVPVLVYAAGQSPQAATATSLVVVGVAALWALRRQHAAGNVRVGAGVVFALAGVGGSLAGTMLNHSLDPDVLLVGFSVVMLVAAAGMWRRAHGSLGAGDEPIDPGAEAADRVADPVSTHTRTRIDTGTVVGVLGAGTLVGFMTGLFGVGGGFVIVPALVLVLGFRMREAVGTSLLVIAISTAVALVPRLGSGVIDLGVVIPFTLAAMLGASTGAKLGQRVDPDRLIGWFAGLLVAVALYTGVSSALAL